MTAEPEPNSDLRTVLDYYLDQAVDDSRPADVLLALCRLRWPDSSFRLVPDSAGVESDSDDDPNPLCLLGDIEDGNGNRVRLT